MSTVAILLSFIAGLSGLAASIKSKKLIPTYRLKFSEIYNIFEPLLWSQQKLFNYIDNDIMKNGGISGDMENPSLELSNAIKTVKENLDISMSNLRKSGLNNILEETSMISQVRFLQILGWLSAAIATIIQLINVYK